MSFCSNCGAPLESDAKFCPNCGTPTQANQPNPNTGAAQQQSVYYGAPNGPQTDFSQQVSNLTNTPDSTGEFDPQDVQNNKVMAVLAYIGILVLVPILAAKESRYARFHANQGMVLFVAGIAVSVATSILSAIHLWILSGIASALSGILLFVLMIIGIVNAAQGRAKELPIIGKFRLIK